MRYHFAPLGALGLTSEAHAHASSRGFVLLLPTDTYTLVGWLVVLLTAITLIVLPTQSAHWLLHSVRVRGLEHDASSCRLRLFISLLSTACLAMLLFIGLTGTHDPLENLLPLVMWTGFWIALVLLHGLLGNLWHWLNPWSGVCSLLQSGCKRSLATSSNSSAASTKSTEVPTDVPDAMPGKMPNVWPATLGLLLFSAFVLSDPAPDDPVRLAAFIAAYWLFTLVLALWIGDTHWRDRGEFLTVLFRAYSWLAPIARKGAELRFGTPGWRTSDIANSTATNTSFAIFVLILLGIGSFDGINETFWWLAKIGVNPLEFPGRSAVMSQTIAGLLLFNGLLIAVFALCVWLGNRLALPSSDRQVPYRRAFNVFAMSLLPIAFAYHLAHYLPTLLVNGQYLFIALGDPLNRGISLLGLAEQHVTTGFFNNLTTVRWILLTQVGAVVAGHLLAVVLAHASAIDLYETRRRAALALLPLTALMTLYTLLGLWLLAAPRGA